MDISTVQKRKFLKNLNKLYYSKGTKPSPQEIRSAFDSYFSVNKFGQPIDVPYDLLESIDRLDPFVMNELMANSLLNLEVLFDCIYENNVEIFNVITVLNKKMEILKRKRLKLEDRIDQILFENSNSDGYFYSFSDQFSDLNNIDLDLTTAHIDLINKKAELPYITSDYSTAITRNRLVPSSIEYSIIVNGETTVKQSSVEDISSMFDGLNDTYWMQTVSTTRQSVVTLTMDIPLNNSTAEVSRIDGNLLTSTPCSVYLRCIPADPAKDEELMSSPSDGDYDTFSFRFASGLYSRAVLTIVKIEPDEVVNSDTSPYLYKFGVRELLIGARYYDIKADIISNPISISTEDNELLDIATVSIEVDDSVPDGTTVKYYVAPDVSYYDGINISSFDWKEIQPTNYNVKENTKFVSLSSSRLRSKKIGSTNADLTLVPLLSQSNAQVSTEANPFTVPYSSASAYRICYINSEEKIIAPYILSGIDTFEHYGLVHDNSGVEVAYYKDRTYWSDTIANSPGSLIKSIVEEQVTSTTTPIQNPSSGVFRFKLFCDQAASAVHTLVKESYDYSISVYVNGSLLVDLPTQTISSSVEWNFNAGVNLIEVYYDKTSSQTVGFNLMSGSSIQQYGTVFLDYYTYVDPIEFRRRGPEGKRIFTIDKIYGQRQLISTNYIEAGSRLYYISSKNDRVNSVRYRVSFRRYLDPLQTPSLDSIRVRFRNS